MRNPAKAAAQIFLATFLAILPSLARAHHAEFMTDKPFLQGVSMPIHGLDHVLVIIAVGLIAAQLGGSAIWAAPATFTASVLLGGILNILGIPVPLAEYGILASIAIFGCVLAWGSRMSILLTLGVVALFASFHGSALIANDGLERSMPQFVAGCLFSALLLQGAGAGLGLLLERWLNAGVYRYAGLAMLVAAGVIAFFPGVNGVVIALFEKSAH